MVAIIPFFKNIISKTLNSDEVKTSIELLKYCITFGLELSYDVLETATNPIKITNHNHTSIDLLAKQFNITIDNLVVIANLWSLDEIKSSTHNTNTTLELHGEEFAKHDL